MDVMTQGRVAAGELVRDPFNDFYRSEWRDVVGPAFVLTGDWGVAEDLAQDGFAAAAQSWGRVGGMDKPGAWVRRVVANRSVSWFRRRAAERRALALFGNPESVAGPELDGQIAEV